VTTLDAIIREAERASNGIVSRALMADDIRFAGLDVRPGSPPGTLSKDEHARALCEAAVALADRTRAAAVVAVTRAGRTARMLAALRPSARILAITSAPKTAARLALVWGVTPVVSEALEPDDVRQTLETLVPTGSIVVFVSMHPVLSRGTNYLRIERL
jgi:pyruvate kinase